MASRSPTSCPLRTGRRTASAVSFPVAWARRWGLLSSPLNGPMASAHTASGNRSRVAPPPVSITGGGSVLQFLGKRGEAFVNEFLAQPAFPSPDVSTVNPRNDAVFKFREFLTHLRKQRAVLKADEGRNQSGHQPGYRDQNLKQVLVHVPPRECATRRTNPT